MTWKTIDSAPKDRWIGVYAPGKHLGLPDIRRVCHWHEDAGFCVDEVRHPTHWCEIEFPAPPDAKCERASGAQDGLASEIERIATDWRGANGGIFAIHGMSLEIAKYVAATLASAQRGEAQDGLPSLSMPQSEQFARNCLAYCAKHGVALNTELSLWSDLLAHRDALALAQRERDALRTIISRCADALGNGAMVSPDCSPAFMSKLPGEIGLYTAFLREDRDTWKERAEKDKARVAELEAALLPIVQAITTSSSLADHDDLPDSFPVEFADIEGSDEPPPLTYGDLRRARNLLNGGSDA